MRQTCESERENGGNNDAERERTSESEIEDLGAQLDEACASRPLDRAQHGMTRRTAATHLLTAVLWLATAVILLAMLLRMLPNNPRRQTVRAAYRRADAVAGFALRDNRSFCNSFSHCWQTETFSRVKRIVRDHPNYLALGVCRSDQ